MLLVKAQGDVEKPVIDIDSAPRHVGRGAENDLVLDDDTVSSRHATLWIEGGRGWIRDGNSRNGTFVNDKRVRLAPLQEGDRVQIGSVQLVVRGAPVATPAFSTRAWFVEDVATGVRYPFRGDRFLIGAGHGADLRLDVDEDAECALSVHEGGVWLTGLDRDEALDAATILEIGGRRLRVLEADLDLAETRDLTARTFSYGLHVRMKGFVGPTATLTDPATGRTHEIDAAHRAVLLYMLVKARLEAAPGDDDAAWCADDDVARGIWGRKGAIDANALHVLVHRLRKELKQAGFEPWFLEKRRRGIRIALTDVAID